IPARRLRSATVGYSTVEPRSKGGLTNPWTVLSFRPVCDSFVWKPSFEWSLAISVGLHWRIGAPAPFRPRSVIHRAFRQAGEAQPERQDAGGDARAAACDRAAGPVDAGGGEAGPQCLGRAERSVTVQKVGVGQAGRTGDVAAAHAGAWFRHRTGEPPGGTRVQNQVGPRGHVAQHVADATQARRAVIGPERS